MTGIFQLILFLPMRSNLPDAGIRTRIHNIVFHYIILSGFCQLSENMEAKQNMSGVFSWLRYGKIYSIIRQIPPREDWV